MFLFVLFSAAPAQFEVAPDHFPSSDELAVQPGSIRVAQREQRITEQQAVRAEYGADIQQTSVLSELAPEEPAGKRDIPPYFSWPTK